MQFNVLYRRAGADCTSIVAELPEWFGIPESNAAYAQRAEQGAWVAEADGVAIGLMILEDHGFSAIENHLLAVRPAAHRSGVGRALIDRARLVAREQNKLFLTVKTLGPSREYAPYAETRAFYRAMGFEPLEEFTSIWGPENPCLLMIMPTG